MTRKSGPKVLEEIALSTLPTSSGPGERKRLWEPRYGDWIRIVRNSLRMTQDELARRAGVNKANLVGIEKGKIDPRLGTLRKVFEALSCDLLVEPRPRQPLTDILRTKARNIALERLKQSMGTMALENQAPDRDVFKVLLEKRTNEILNDRREHLWRNGDERRERNSRRNRR
jgi:predicted DNA-binding mobile mystery protein A